MYTGQFGVGQGYLVPRMFPIWNFIVEILAPKIMLNLGWILQTIV